MREITNEFITDRDRIQHLNKQVTDMQNQIDYLREKVEELLLESFRRDKLL